MASFQSHRLRHMTAQQGPKLTHLTFLSLITYMSSSGWGPLGVVLSHRKSYIIITFSKNCHSFSMCWRICPNNTAKDNRDYKGIKKLHLETNILIPFIFSGDLRNCLPELGNNFFTISLSTIILSFHLVLAIIKICKRKKYDPYSLKMHTKKDTFMKEIYISKIIVLCYFISLLKTWYLIIGMFVFLPPATQ